MVKYCIVSSCVFGYTMSFHTLLRGYTPYCRAFEQLTVSSRFHCVAAKLTS